MMFTMIAFCASAQLQISGKLRILRPLTLKVEDINGKVIVEIKIENGKEFSTKKVNIEPDLYKVSIGEREDMMVLENKPIRLSGYLNDKEVRSNPMGYKVETTSTLTIDGNQDLTKQYEELISQYMGCRNDKAKIEQFMETNTSTDPLLMAALLYRFNPKVVEFYESVSKRMNKNSNSQLANYVTAEIKTRSVYKVGGDVENFTLVDKENKEVSLSDFKGRLVLLDFWASWCAPCRMEMKSLHKIYDEIKGDDLVFISISLDDDRNKWLKAMETDAIPWVALWDKDGFKKSRFREQFGFTAIPFIVLIDKEGKTISRQLRGEDVRTAIENARK